MKTQCPLATIHTAALALALGAGAAQPWPAYARAEDSRDKAMEASADAARSFRLASELLGRDVVNPNDATIGDIEDFIIDRGAGRIEYALVKGGDVMGIGGKTIAVPLERFRHDQVNRHLVLEMTKEQVNAAAEFVPANWHDLRETSWLDDLDWKLTNEDQRRAATHDPYRIAIEAVTEQKVRGEILDVQREYPIVQGARSPVEIAVVRIRTDDGRTRSYILGPSWYVMGHTAAPMRGDKVEAAVRRCSRDGFEHDVIMHATIDGRKIELRDASARPVWEPIDGTNHPGSYASRERRTGRLAYMTDLIGATAQALDEDGGEIEDAVIETGSGRIVFVCFDPNENFLGIADTVRCIPWTVASFGLDGKVRFDATQQMLISAMEMPTDPAMLNSSSMLDAAYQPFNVTPPRFDDPVR